MLSWEEWMEARSLLAQGCSIREVARLTGYSRNTVAKLGEHGPPGPIRRRRASQLDPHKEYLRRRYAECPLSAVRLLAEIQPMGYRGSLSVLRRFVATLKPARVPAATVRFETPPGHQAQMDWGYCGTFTDPQGQGVRLYLFAMVLGFSRALYVEFTTSMDTATLLQCHQRAFAYFGGCPRELLYDNLKQVRLLAGPQGKWNPLFADFAAHYGFRPRVCRVRRPQTKGKVERAIGYVKDSFLKGRSFADLATLNAQAHAWLEHTAQQRVHGTTGRRPAELLREEGLLPLPGLGPYPVADRCLRRVDREGYVHLQGSRYSAPPERVGQQVLVEQGGQRVILRADALIIAEHPQAPRKGACVTDPAHLAALWKLTAERTPPPPASVAWAVTFDQEVAVRSLGVYAEVTETGAPLAGGAA